MISSTLAPNIPLREISNKEPAGRIKSKHDFQRRVQAINRVKCAIQYMLNHVDKPLRVSSLSSVMAVSSSQCFNLFKYVTGSTPITFFNRLRMRHACRLLTEKDLCIKEVSAQMGFRDQFYFSRLFKSVNGLTPSRYRRLSAAWKRGQQAGNPVWNA